MKIIADFHIHSKYSRATSKQMIIPEISKWAKLKGIDLIGTADFTHPGWFRELKKYLKPLNNGLFEYEKNAPKFILSSEIALIYSQDKKVRRVHIVIIMPDFDSVEKLNKKLGIIGNLFSDGRPILGLSSEELVKIVLDINPKAVVIPAHIWTPWFSVLGSFSNYNSYEECFGSMNKYVFTAETGLSSDPEANWRLSMLDKITLVSNSDAHSLPNLGREANVFNLKKDYSYDDIYKTIKDKNPKTFPYTIEFYPEEGKYHFDGHKSCNLVFHPDQSKIYNNICPSCGKKITIGVYHRINELADREEGYIPKNFPSSKHIVPLAEIISEFFQVSKNSKKVKKLYDEYTSYCPEFKILIDLSEDEMKKFIHPVIIRGILKVRNNKVIKKPGYDGVYGVIKVLDGEKYNKKLQHKLF